MRILMQAVVSNEMERPLVLVHARLIAPMPIDTALSKYNRRFASVLLRRCSVTPLQLQHDPFTWEQAKRTRLEPDEFWLPSSVQVSCGCSAPQVLSSVPPLT